MCPQSWYQNEGRVLFFPLVDKVCQEITTTCKLTSNTNMQQKVQAFNSTHKLYVYKMYHDHDQSAN